ncbi:MAG TPA: hypothetical protein VK731_06760 [Candidatus Cybelea sp.]|jgi:hypothetical protein|nr:hypothetical protein [Candidatus Cybelea sp.]
MRNLPQRAADYYSKARKRAQRRKSPWNIFLIVTGFAVWLSIWYGLFRLVWLFHVSFYPDHQLKDFLNHSGHISVRNFVCGFLMLFAPLPGAIALGLVLNNVLFWLIVPIRRIFDAEARGYPGTGFRDAQKALLRFAARALTIGLFLALVGAYFLNSVR